MTLEQYKKELEDQLTIMKLLTREVRANIVISEEEIKDYYKNNEKQYALPEEAHLRIMLFKESDDAGMKKAADILSEIKTGPTSLTWQRNTLMTRLQRMAVILDLSKRPDVSRA